MGEDLDRKSGAKQDRAQREIAKGQCPENTRVAATRKSDRERRIGRRTLTQATSSSDSSLGGVGVQPGLQCGQRAERESPGRRQAVQQSQHCVSRPAPPRSRYGISHVATSCAGRPRLCRLQECSLPRQVLVEVNRVQTTGARLTAPCESSLALYARPRAVL